MQSGVESSPRVGVVGAGIIGLAVARELQRVDPGAAITVFDKELVVGAHQTAHNSGVVHAGLYYAPGSLKARLCRRGMFLLRDFCAQRGLAYDERGKLVVARDECELAGLRAIETRARANGVPDLAWLAGAELRELEPEARGVAALHSPRTAIVDFAVVAAALADEVAGAGGALRLGTEVTAMDARGDRVDVVAGGERHRFDRLVVCAGLQSDRLARRAGDARAPAIVPFRGEYYRLRAERRGLVRRLIYPVPDPAYPFLGVHFTPRIDGNVDIGPNAVLALAREAYRRRDVRPRDVIDAVSAPGFVRFATGNWRAGLRELRGSLSRRAFLREARRFVPALRDDDVVRAPAGVRAQALGADGALLDDFCLTDVGAAVFVRNAPSPAATSSLAIAETIVQRLALARR
jgi:L-2-hydroxyglutarate oxidase LhgO